MTGPTWRSEPPPDAPPITPLGWLRVALRGTATGLVTFGGLAALLLLRQVERPLFGLHRPWTPWITLAVCRSVLAILGLRVSRSGAAMGGPGAVVANHSSWLDIFVLNSGDRVYFVSKSEVRDWPGIGWLARATGTLFIRRDPREAAAQRDLMAARLAAGHRLLFFPEGTSTDGRRVLPFKTSLFQAFLENGLPEGLRLQPVTVVYHAPRGAAAEFYGWWGEMDFGPHLLKVLAAPRQGRVEVIRHEPVPVAAYRGRKALAARSEAPVRAALEERL